MNFSDWQTIFSKYGIIGVIFMCFIAIVIYRPNWYKKIFDFFKKKDKSAISESQISNHLIFTHIDFWLFHKVPTFNFKSKFRTKVFRDYLTIYLRVYKTNMEEFVKNKQFEKWDNSEFWKNLLDLLIIISEKYEAEMNREGIPPLIVEKMRVKNNDSVTLMVNLIKGVSGSEFYDSEKNFLRVFSILNIILPVLENTILHSDEVCNGINGDLGGLTYKGETEPIHS